MSVNEAFLARFRGEGPGAPLFVPDLQEWYRRNSERSAAHGGGVRQSILYEAQALNVPLWKIHRPWTRDTPGVTVRTTEEGTSRRTVIEAPSGVVTARWNIGPDGDYWQVEYPAKTGQDLRVIREYAEALRYQVALEELTTVTHMVGDDGVVAVELPAHGFQTILLEFLGFSDGLMLLAEAPEEIEAIASALTSARAQLIGELSGVPNPVFYSPDNLDGQFVSPGLFDTYLAEDYRQSVAALEDAGKYLVIHAGGPIASLAETVAATGVHCVAGIAGPPQADLELAAAREKLGGAVVLWGGIPQDFLLAETPRAELEQAAKMAAERCREDPRIIIGIADHVPPNMERSRLERVVELVSG
jgi:hypothetical protein